MLLKIPNFDSYDQNEAYGSIKIYPKEDQKNIIILYSFLFFFFFSNGSYEMIHPANKSLKNT